MEAYEGFVCRSREREAVQLVIERAPGRHAIVALARMNCTLIQA